MLPSSRFDKSRHFSFPLRYLEKSFYSKNTQISVSGYKLVAVKGSEIILRCGARYLIPKNNSICVSSGVNLHLLLNGSVNAVYHALNLKSSFTWYHSVHKHLDVFFSFFFYRAGCPSSPGAGLIWGCRLLANAFHPGAWWAEMTEMNEFTC